VLIVFLMAIPDTETGSLSTRWGMCSRNADTMTLPSCIALIALTYRLRARNVRNRGSVKRGVHPRDERLKSGRPGKPISETFGAAVRVSKQAAFSPCIQADDWQSCWSQRPLWVSIANFKDLSFLGCDEIITMCRIPKPANGNPW
jgi:hypothetical protein